MIQTSHAESSQVGLPAERRTIPLNVSTFDESEIEKAIAVLRSGFVTMGKCCRQFEQDFSATLDTPHSVMVNSGSSANLLTFFALANPQLPVPSGKRTPQSGGEIIVPAVTWSTTIWPIVQAGFVPVFVDSDSASLQMDVSAVENAIGPQTVAICAVHVLGNTVEILRLKELADKHGLWLIEDTCESLGARYSGRPVGTFGDFGTFSFYFSHHITTIEGGMVVTRTDECAELLRCMRAHGWARDLKSADTIASKHSDLDPRFLFVNTGFNLRPTEINGAFGIEQLKKLERFNGHRNQAANCWLNLFSDLSERGLMVPMQIAESAHPAWFGFPVVCDCPETRNGLREHLTRWGVETRPIICGNMARQPAMNHIRHRVHAELKGADRIMDCGLYWGIHPQMTADDLTYVAQVVHGYFEQAGSLRNAA